MSELQTDSRPKAAGHASLLGRLMAAWALLGCLDAPGPAKEHASDPPTGPQPGGREGNGCVEFLEPGTRVLFLAFSPDGRQLAIACSPEKDPGSGKVVLWDLAARKRSRTFDGLLGFPFSNTVAFAPDGRRLATICLEGSGDEASGAAIVWDLQTGERERTFAVDDRMILSVAFAPDGRLLATGEGWVEGKSMRGSLALWDSGTGRRLKTLQEKQGFVGFVAFSPEGRLLLTVHSWIAFSAGHPRHSYVVLWDAETGEALRTFEGRRDDVLCAAFAPSGGRIATGGHLWDYLSGGGDSGAKLWDIETGKRIRTFSKAPATPECVAFSPDGRLLATASITQGVVLWDVETGAELKALKRDNAFLRSMAFSPDSRQLATGWVDGSVRIWRLPEESRPQENGQRHEVGRGD